MIEGFTKQEICEILAAKELIILRLKKEIRNLQLALDQYQKGGDGDSKISMVDRSRR